MDHIQGTVTGWKNHLHVLPDKTLVKAVDQGQIFAEVKEINKNIYTCLRHHYDAAQVFGGDYEANKQRARVFFDTFIDGTFRNDIAPYCDYIEEWNEYLANSQNEAEVAERVLWAKAAADVWLNEYRNVHSGLRHIKLVLCNTAIGNWIDKRFAEIANTYDAAIGYHPYTMWKNKVRWGEDDPLDNTVLDTLDWVNLSGLWDTMEYDWGIDVEWVFTEAGPFESAIDGWRSSNCLGGDLDLYVSAVRDWIRDVKQTPAYKEDRIRGFALFTTRNYDSTWKHFLTYAPQLDALAVMVKQEWNPGENGGTQPVPEPTNNAHGIDISRWQGSMDWNVADTKIDFAIFKATESSSWVDPKFHENEQATRDIIRGAYHFFSPFVNGTLQANHFLNTLNPYDFDILAVDVEYAPVERGELELFMKSVQEKYPDKRFLLYTSPGFYGSHLRGVDWTKYADLWIAHWGVASPTVPSPYTEWTVWQYTNNGNGAEYGADSTNIDLNSFNGTRAELISWVNKSVPPPLANVQTITASKLRTQPYYTGQRGEDTYLLTVPKDALLELVNVVQGEAYMGSNLWNEVNIWVAYNTLTSAVPLTGYIHTKLTKPA